MWWMIYVDHYGLYMVGLLDIECFCKIKNLDENCMKHLKEQFKKRYIEYLDERKEQYYLDDLEELEKTNMLGNWDLVLKDYRKIHESYYKEEFKTIYKIVNEILESVCSET